MHTVPSNIADLIIIAYFFLKSNRKAKKYFKKANIFLSFLFAVAIPVFAVEFDVYTSKNIKKIL